MNILQNTRIQCIPALASSTGVGFWRLSSSVCHMEVISRTYKDEGKSWSIQEQDIKYSITILNQLCKKTRVNIMYTAYISFYLDVGSIGNIPDLQLILCTRHISFFTWMQYQSETYQIFNQHFLIFKSQVRPIIVVQKMLQEILSSLSHTQHRLYT